MRTLTTMIVAAALFVQASVACAQVDRVQANYTGTDSNWFNPLNWSTGLVPDENTDVVISGNSRVVIDPTRGSSLVNLRSLTLTRHAILETEAGTVFQSRNEIVENRARLIHRSTEAGSGPVDGLLLVTWNAGLVLNPTPKTKRDIVLQSTATVSFGLGGTTPASPSVMGNGTYATLTGEDVQVGGRLKVELYYGFTPRDGDTFTIVRSTLPITGNYRGLQEGSMVARFGQVGLFLTYGRDGAGQVREHVLLARQI